MRNNSARSFAVRLGTRVAAAAVVVAVLGGCSHSTTTNAGNLDTAFKKTAAPDAYAVWQKKMASGGGMTTPKP